MIKPNELTFALDCSVKNVSLALIKDQKILTSFDQICSEPQSTTLLKIIDQVFKECGVELSQIKNILYCHGPGSFTSLRIGLATLKGMFLEADCSYYQTSSLLFRCLSDLNQKSLSTIQMGRDRIAVGLLEESKFSFEEKVVTRAELDEMVQNKSCHINREKTDVKAFLKIISSSSYQAAELSEAQINYMVKPQIS